MAGSLVLKGARIAWGGTVVSTRANQVTINYGAETQDATAFSDGTRINKGGLKTWDISVEFFTDESTSGSTSGVNLNETMFADVGSSTTIAVRPTTNATSSTNPEYTGTGLLSAFSPLSGSVGDMAAATAEIASAGTLSRNTA